MFGIWRSGQLVPHDCAGVSNGLLSRYRWWGGLGTKMDWMSTGLFWFWTHTTQLKRLSTKDKPPYPRSQSVTADITLALWKQQDIILDEVCYYMSNNHTGCFGDHTCIMYYGKKSKEFFIHCYIHRRRWTPFITPNSSRKYFHLQGVR